MHIGSILLFFLVLLACMVNAVSAGEGDYEVTSISTDGTPVPVPEPDVPIAAAAAEAATPQKSTKQRHGINKKTINADKLEKAWETGDDQIELEHEFEINRRIGTKVQSKKLNLDDPTSIQKLFKKDPLASTGLSGSTVMMFADLKSKQANGKDWTKLDIEKLASRWSQLMRSGSLSCTVYNISGEDLSVPKLLLNVDRGWTTSEIIRFVLQQPETVKVSKDNRDYTPEQYNEVEDD